MTTDTSLWVFRQPMPEALAKLRTAMTAAPRPLDGPFMSAARLTDYSDDPGYAILLPDRAGEAERLAAKDRKD